MSMQGWIKDELSKCLCFEIPDAMISYICSIREGGEIDEYFRTLLDFNNPEHVKFLGDLKRRMGTRQPGTQQTSKQTSSAAPSGKQKKQSDPPQQKPQPQQQPKGKAGPTVPTSNSGTAGTQLESKPVAGGSKKKPKFVSLYGENGELKNVVKLKGRHHCDCQAVKHKLINNCLHCGRIVCEQEGSGPCLFCGSLVCTAEEQQLIDAASRKGNQLKRTLMEQERPNGWAEALATRNRLLEYDRNSARRTAVIDDESDYFRTNSVWLNDAERSKLEQLEEELREQKHASRLSRKITIDFAGRQVIEEPALTGEVEEAILRSVDETLSGKSKTKPTSKGGNDQESLSDQSIVADGTSTHPRLIGPAPLFVESGNCPAPQGFRPSNGFDGVYSRLQDKQFLEMSDLRHCLSMHQPWASLLVAGIKRHEGRTWYSSHRGRLWIASTAKPVAPEMVQELEDFYRRQYPNEKLEFPSQYPAGCLLGCVSVEDCLPQEEYRKQYPDGESESPYVFICTDAQELPIRFPVKGDHKIYMLESKIHQAAVKSLQRLAPSG
uniref:Putative activating signal cointegrator 1 n=1 Tax=Anopheles marajoara TaxID=58244 RepID=A0A2M4BJ76_9DIPT